MKFLKNWRANLILISILLFGAAIISRLISLQIIDYDFHKALAQGQQSAFKLIKGQRGQVFFSNGEILATNSEGSYVFVSPEEIEEKEQTAEKLAEVLNIDEEELYLKIQKDSLFEKVKEDLTEEEQEVLKQKNLEGVYLGQMAQRSYPQETMASGVIGFVGGSGSGQYGIEGYYNEVLQGKEEFKQSRFSKRSNGSNVFLGIDYNIQFMAERTLKKAQESLNIEGGQIIIIDPNTGKIVALADFPGFDPNSYSEIEDFDIFQNGAVQKLFEPGSTLKPFTMAAALDQGKISPQTTYVDEGVVRVSGYNIENYNSRVFGETTMTEVLEKSINTGAVFAENQVGHWKFLEYLDKFGFFSPTKIDIQGEVSSENRGLKKGYEVNFATASFGQGIEITPMQLVRGFSAIANGGKLIKPYVVEKIVNSDGEIEETQSTFSDRIISSTTASKLTAMLVSVLENGYAKSGKIPGYYIAGKTGTAQVPFSAIGIDKKGYSDKTWQSFIGFFPAFSPKFLILVKLDNPETRTAEYSALPIFKELAKYIIDYYAIPPDY